MHANCEGPCTGKEFFFHTILRLIHQRNVVAMVYPELNKTLDIVFHCVSERKGWMLE
jgi:hypothetical protein